jgi:hypothetical protein
VASFVPCFVHDTSRLIIACSPSAGMGVASGFVPTVHPESDNIALQQRRYTCAGE